ncbi:hypothetical protein ElyMa_004011400 [Elysia marginata]|uniref:Uncharacterized protein n=1 Tax=Elysia marginata TaxID=1093978 RepID=A0AAV4G0J2_9GAST|nr:hypothetical protein ElyMa_004011400 [Elysia marginata]
MARWLHDQRLVSSVTISKKSEKLDHRLELSLCKNFSKQDLMYIDELKDIDEKLDILIEFVCRIKLEHAWDHIQPHELNNAHTSLTNCKKGSLRKNSQGH